MDELISFCLDSNQNKNKVFSTLDSIFFVLSFFVLLSTITNEFLNIVIVEKILSIHHHHMNIETTQNSALVSFILDSLSICHFFVVDTYARMCQNRIVQTKPHSFKIFDFDLKPILVNLNSFLFLFFFFFFKINNN